MKYIALLRGINVGGHRKVAMKRLKTLFESLGYTNVVTYLNSGNVIFESDTKQELLQAEIPIELKNEFEFEIPTLVKNEQEIKRIATPSPRTGKTIPNKRQISPTCFLKLTQRKPLMSSR